VSGPAASRQVLRFAVQVAAGVVSLSADRGQQNLDDSQVKFPRSIPRNCGTNLRLHSN